jgi:hypothetical protein
MPSSPDGEDSSQAFRGAILFTRNDWLYGFAMSSSIASTVCGAHPPRWLPIGLDFNRNGVAVEWMDFGADEITEQFFSRTVERLRSMNPPAPERTSGFELLIQEARRFPLTRPAGVIFHVSRCGSTLLCNVLRTAAGIGVLSEARPIERAFKPRVFERYPLQREAYQAQRELLANSVLSRYAHQPGGGSLRLVIKSCAVDMMQIPLIRSIWPDVPSVVLIRDPLEVLVSNLSKAAGWCDRRNRAEAHLRTFGPEWGDLGEIAVEEYLARGVGSFCEAALRSIDERCKVVDYANLSLPTIYKIADFFGIRMPAPECESVQRAFALDAKNFSSGRSFEKDRERKRLAASEMARRWVQRWVEPHYTALKAREKW